MTKARFVENVIEICTGDGSMELLLPYMFEQLELCQKSLAGYPQYISILYFKICFIQNTCFKLLQCLDEIS
jgi:hypothetical protein